MLLLLVVLLASGAGLTYLVVRHAEELWEAATAHRRRRGDPEVWHELQRLSSKEYRQFGDLIIPARVGSSTTRIAHVVVANTGLFVIETQRFESCVVTGGPHLKEWPVKYLDGRKDKIRNPVRANTRRIDELSTFLGIDGAQFHNIVVFVGNSGFEGNPGPEVFRVPHYVEHIESFRTPVLDRNTLERVAAVLSAQAKLSRSPNLRATHLAKFAGQ